MSTARSCVHSSSFGTWSRGPIGRLVAERRDQRCWAARDGEAARLVTTSVVKASASPPGETIQRALESAHFQTSHGLPGRRHRRAARCGAALTLAGAALERFAVF